MRMAIAFALERGLRGHRRHRRQRQGRPRRRFRASSRCSTRATITFRDRATSRAGRESTRRSAERSAFELLHAPLISLAAGTRYTDTTNGFRAYSRRLLTDPRVQPLRDIFVGLRAALLSRDPRRATRLPVTETPVTRRYPTTGKTPTKISPVKGNLLILRTLAAAALGRFNP